MSGLVRLRTAATAAMAAAAASVLLAGCGEDAPTRIKDVRDGPTCRTTGTVEAEPAGDLRSAFEPYVEPGHKVKIEERFGDTAEVQLRSGASGPAPARVSLVRTGEGWVVTAVLRC